MKICFSVWPCVGRLDGYVNDGLTALTLGAPAEDGHEFPPGLAISALASSNISWAYFVAARIVERTRVVAARSANFEVRPSSLRVTVTTVPLPLAGRLIRTVFVMWLLSFFLVRNFSGNSRNTYAPGSPLGGGCVP